MKLQNIRLTVGITTSGKAQVLYCGPDSEAAATACAAAGPDFAEVGVWPTGTMPLRPRYPAKEAAAAKVAEGEAQARASADLNRKKAAVDSKLAASKQLTAEAAALQEEILKSASTISPEATLTPKKSKK